MAEHLPECMTSVVRMNYDCICPELRACEQRVRADERSWEGAVVVARAGYQDGYDAALRDASDAVEDQPDIIFRGAAWVKHEHALFAIDALQGKR